jgi:NAD(P)-dependent dehydrogenase (short-subunit alcohol dehydrogenase family)
MTRTLVITGASDGIGAAAARLLARDPANRLVLVGRSASKTAAVAAEVGAEAHVADFADLAQVRRLADDLLATCERIDVLANNAGGIFSGPVLTVDGFERTFQVNHLAPFLLTNLLRERLVASAASVVATSSIAARLYSDLDLDDLDCRERFRPNRAYGNGKLANILFTTELQARWGGDGVSAVAFHPGNVATSFASDTTSPFRWVYHTALRAFLISPERGGSNLAHFVDGRPGTGWQPGAFYGSDLRIARTHPKAYDTDLARTLWDRSAAMVGLA